MGPANVLNLNRFGRRTGKQMGTLGNLKRLGRKALLPWLTGYSNNDWYQSRLCFSQFGEDIGLIHLLGDEAGLKRTYVDVGAYDPVYLSNTYELYRRGWSGLVIDANPSVIARYASRRPRDIAINAFVGDLCGSVDFSIFDADMFSTLTSNIDSVPERWRKGERRISVRCVPLSDLLVESEIRDISLLNVDAEGCDLKVLQSLDWDRWQPTVVCCEDHADDWTRSPTQTFLVEHGYSLCGRYGVTSIFNSRFNKRLKS